MTQGFRGLKVYQKSYEMVKVIYAESAKFPKEEQYGIIIQIRRASVSVALNIAEGYGRKLNPLDYRSFLIISKGSCNEMQVLTELCRDLGYITSNRCDEITGNYDEISRMLEGLIKSLTTSTNKLKDT